MDEEQKELPAPPRFRYKLIKYGTLTLLFLAILLFTGFTGLKATSSSKFCASCHDMKPEYYTWKASTHSEVECTNCHIEPGAKNLAKDKANGIVQLYKNVTNTYTAPIQMPKDIPNSACDRCHNMKNRDVTPSKDLIIPHDKHLAKDIKCTECHSGVAHGKISERNVTFKSDYEKWDDSLGKAMMKDVKFTNPKMETCMDCHEARGVSIECETCHKTGMIPDSHKYPDFKTQKHGKLAAKKDIKECNNCHQYMSEDEITGIETIPPAQQFLSTGKVNQKSSITAQEYAIENTFCKKCHATRPPSHVKGFVNLHGEIAIKDSSKCKACHEFQFTGFNKTKTPTCSSCHPAMHDGKNYKERHPISLAGVTQPSQRCYTCHNKPRCTSCHKEN